MNRTPSKYLDDAEPIMKAKARMTLLRLRNKASGLLSQSRQNWHVRTKLSQYNETSNNN